MPGQAQTHHGRIYWTRPKLLAEVSQANRCTKIAGNISKTEPTSREGPRLYRLAIGGLILFAHLGIGINFFSVSPLLTLITADYGISSATGGLLLGLSLLVAAAFGLPGGALVARLGAERVFGIGGFMAGVLALSAVAPTYPSLLVLRLGYGVGFAFVLTATGPLLMRWFQPREILVWNSLNTATISLGIALSMATAAPLAEHLGWQNTLGLFGGIALVSAVTWPCLVVSRSLQGMYSRPLRDGRGRSSHTPFGPRRLGSDQPAIAARLSLADMATVLRNRTVALLVAADAGILVQYTALTNWLPTFYTGVRGLTLSQAGLVTGIIPMVGVVAVLLGGFLPSRTGNRRMYFLVPGIMAALGGPGSFLLGDLAGISIAAVLLGLGSWLYVPLLLALPMELRGMTPERVGIVWGTYVTVGGVGMFLSPLLVGALRDLAGGFLPGFLVCAVAGWTLVAAGLLIPKDML